MTLSEKDIGREAGRIGGATLLSRILGLVRDMLFASLFGTTVVADAFNLAFLLPNTLRLALGEGAARSAFVPVYTETLVRQGEERARELAAKTVALWVLVLGGVSLAGSLLAGPLVRLYAFGWREAPAALQLSTGLTRFLFPFILLAGVTAILGGLLNSHHRFGAPALAPVALNLGMIGAALLVCPRLGGPREAVWGFAAGAMVGGAAQIVIQIPSLHGIGFRPRIWPGELSSPIRRMGRLLVPAVVGLAVLQLNTLVDTILATHLEEGSVTALRLGNRVMLMPLGVFGIAIATAALPALSSLAAAEDRERLRATLWFTLRSTFAVLAPAALGLALLAPAVIRALFERGAFGPQVSTPLTATALFYYALGLPAFGMVKGLAQVFYALQDTSTPVKAGAFAMIANVVLNLLLMGPMGIAGLALATSLAGYLNFCLLLAFLGRRIEGAGSGAFVFPALRILALALVSTGLARWLHDLLLGAGEGAWAEVGPLSAAVGAGIIAYVVLARLTRADEVNVIWESLRGQMGGRR